MLHFYTVFLSAVKKTPDGIHQDSRCDFYAHDEPNACLEVSMTRFRHDFPLLEGWDQHRGTVQQAPDELVIKVAMSQGLK